MRLCWDKTKTAAWWAGKAIQHEEHGTGWPSTTGHHHYVMALVRSGVRIVTVIASRDVVWDGNHRLVAALVQRRQGKFAPSRVGVMREITRWIGKPESR
jgi:hypothetical protein